MNKLPSIEILNEYFSYNPESGCISWIKARSQSKIGSIAGSINNRGYLRIQFFGVSYLAHRIAWKMYYGVDPNDIVDHKNGEKADNRISNLRDCNKSQNGANRSKASKSNTGIRGVSWCKRRRKYCSYISKDGKNRYLGSFEHIDDAVEAYNNNAKILFGNFARII